MVYRLGLCLICWHNFGNNRTGWGLATHSTTYKCHRNGVSAALAAEAMKSPLSANRLHTCFSSQTVRNEPCMHDCNEVDGLEAFPFLDTSALMAIFIIHSSCCRCYLRQSFGLFEDEVALPAQTDAVKKLFQYNPLLQLRNAYFLF